MKRTWRFAIVLLVLTTLVHFGCSDEEKSSSGSGRSKRLPDAEELSPKDAYAEMQTNKDLFVLDIRSIDDYERSHIAGCVLIPRGMLKTAIKDNSLYPKINRGRTPGKDQPILIYCKKGRKSRTGAKVLYSLGYSDVRIIKGGIKQWIADGLKVEGSAKATSSPASADEATTQPSVDESP